jgi:dihydrofolate reductase
MLSIIAAVARNGVIGKDNQLLWHLPEDMRHFRETTRGKPVIMGRNTWESLPDAFRPLPGRHNIVISRNPAYQPAGATLASTLEDAILKAGDAEEVFVIGGAELYRQALPIADRLYLTEIDQDYEGDAFFPDIPKTCWERVSRKAMIDSSGAAFVFALYRRPP